MNKEQSKHHDQHEHLGHINRMTEYTLKCLKAKLETLKKQDKQYSLDIGEAGGSNDFHDNFAFDEANRLHEGALAQIAELEKITRDVQIVHPREEISSVGIGNEVSVSYDNEEPFTVTILCPLDATMKRDGWISYKSVLGDALIDHRCGDVINIPKVDDIGRRIGDYSVMILSIAPAAI
jgi:transcription elongation GreA/GreB family factor